MSHLRVPSSPLFDAAGKRHRLYLGLVSSSRASILLSSSISAGVGQRRLFIGLDSRSAQRSHASTSGRGEIILLHNHLSGDPTPSRKDLRLTRQLVECS